MFNRRLISFIGIFFSIGLFIWLLIKSDFTIVYKSLSSLPISLFIILFLLQILTVLLIGIQWNILFKAGKITITLKNTLMMNFIGTFFESITPAMKSGGEGFKLLYLKKLNITLAQSTPILLSQKVVSFSCFILLTLFGLVGTLTTLSQTIQTTTFIGILLIVIFIIGLLITGMIMVKKTGQNNFISTFKDTLSLIVFELKKHKIQFTILVLISFSIWILFALKFLLITQQFNLSLSISEIASLTYIPYTIGLLPLSPGGLGTFEATMTYLLSPLFTTYTEALTITLIFRFFSHWLVFILAGMSFIVQSLSTLRGEKHV